MRPKRLTSLLFFFLLAGVLAFLIAGIQSWVNVGSLAPTAYGRLLALMPPSEDFFKAETELSPTTENPYWAWQADITRRLAESRTSLRQYLPPFPNLLLRTVSRLAPGDAEAILLLNALLLAFLLLLAADRIIRLGVRPWLAFSMAAAFPLHPTASLFLNQPQGTGPLLACLLTLLAWRAFESTRPLLARWPAAFLFLLAALSDDSSVIWVPVILLSRHDRPASNQEPADSTRSFSRRLYPLLGLIGLFLIFRLRHPYPGEFSTLTDWYLSDIVNGLFGDSIPFGLALMSWITGISQHLFLGFMLTWLAVGLVVPLFLAFALRAAYRKTTPFARAGLLGWILTEWLATRHGVQPTELLLPGLLILFWVASLTDEFIHRPTGHPWLRRLPLAWAGVWLLLALWQDSTTRDQNLIYNDALRNLALPLASEIRDMPSDSTGYLLGVWGYAPCLPHAASFFAARPDIRLHILAFDPSPVAPSIPVDEEVLRRLDIPRTIPQVPAIGSNPLGPGLVLELNKGSFFMSAADRLGYGPEGHFPMRGETVYRGFRFFVKTGPMVHQQIQRLHFFIEQDMTAPSVGVWEWTPGAWKRIETADLPPLPPQPH